MKTKSLLSLLATALTGAASLFAQPSADSVRLHLEVDRTVLPADSTERAIVKIGLNCLPPPRRTERAPVNLAIVIDRSGSMGGDKIIHAREAALAAVRRLGPDDIVALIAYDSEVETLVPARKVGNGRSLEAAIRGITARGNTALHGGVIAGAAELRQHIEDEYGINRIILLSDGLANVGPSSPEELGRLGHALMKEGISVTTIGLGLGYNEDLMARLAARSDGNTYFVQNSADLPGIFSAELGDVLNVVARRVVIEIDFPENVRPLRFVGRDGVIRGRRAELTLSQLYGGQEKYALVEVEVAPATDGAECEIARAAVRYDDVLNQRAGALTAERKVQFARNRTLVVASANHAVQSEYAENIIAVTKDEAIGLVDAGKRDQAAALLRQRTSELQVLGSTYQNKSVEVAAAAAAPEAAAIEAEGLDNAKRKAYRAESQQVRTQQSTSSSGR